MAGFWDGYNQKGGGTPTIAPIPMAGKGFWAGYKAPSTPYIEPVDPNTLGNTKALSAALKAGQITQQQFADRFNKLNNKSAPAPYSVGNTFSALGNALNQVIVKPVVAVPKSAYDIGRGAAASVTNNKVALANANKAKATDEPQVLSPVARPLIQIARTIEHPFTSSTFTPKSSNAQQVFGNAPVQNIAAGVQSTAKTHGKLAGALYGAGQVGQDVAALAALKGVGESEGAVGGARKTITNAKQTFINGPQQLLRDTATQRLTAAGEKANTPTKIPVQGEDVSPTGVPVRTPVHAGIKEVSTTTKIGVRTPNQMSDAAFTKEFNQLSKGYERDTKSLQNLPPARAKALTNSLETHYQAKLNDLLDRYHNPELTAPKAPKTIASSVSKAEKNTGGLQSPLVAAVQKARSQPVRGPSAFDKVEVAQSTETTPKASQTASTKPTEPTQPTQPRTPAGTEKVSGSSLRTQQEAVQAGMKSEAENTGATFNTVSHKDEAANAVKLVNEDPQKAMDIAMGKTRGDNVSHESAVYHAVKNAEIEKAKKTGDWSTVTDLANSQRHTAVSEAAQRLGAEGYNVNPHDPVSIMNDLAKTRQQAAKTVLKTTPEKEAVAIGKAVKENAPKVTRQNWHDFIDGLKC